MEKELRDAEIMDRIFDCIDKKIIPDDNDLLLFHRKGCKLLTVSKLWNGVDTLLDLQFNYHLLYPIVNIKDVLIVSIQ
jgi:hypothetical protein